MRPQLSMSAAVLALVTLSGCVATSPAWDRSFGSAVRASLAAQVINPAASGNLDPVTGIDSRAAIGAQQQYEKSFSQPGGYQPAMVSGSGR